MWTKDALNDLVKNKLQEHKLIVVANREPYQHRYVQGRIECLAPASGMVSTEPTAGPSRHSPRTPGDRFSPALIAGIRAAQVPADSPATTNTTVTGARARRLAQRSAMPGCQGPTEP